MNQVPQAPVNTGKGLSIAGLILGIAAVVLGFMSMMVFSIIGMVCGVVGLILAVLGRKKAIAAGAGKGLGTAALILSIIGLALSVVGFIACTLCVACANQAANEITEGSLNDLASQLEELSSSLN